MLKPVSVLSVLWLTTTAAFASPDIDTPLVGREWPLLAWLVLAVLMIAIGYAVVHERQAHEGEHLKRKMSSKKWGALRH